MLQRFELQRYVISTILTRGTSTFLNFIITLVIARHAGPVVKGDVTLLITTYWFILFFSNILGGQVLVYVMPRSKLELLLIPAYVWALFVSVIAFLVLHFSHILPDNIILPVTIIGLLSSIVGIHQSIFLGKKQFYTANRLALLPLLLQTIGVIICFYLFNINNAFGFIYATLISLGITIIVGGYLIREHLFTASFTDSFLSSELWSLFRKGAVYQTVEILQLLNLRFYFFQLGLQQGNRYLGIYSTGIFILEAVWIIPRSISTIHYVNISHSDKLQKEAKRTVRLLQVGLVLSAAALLLLWFVPSEVYATVFGHGFRDVRHSIRFLFPGILVYNLWIIISSFYYGTGHYKPLLISNVIGVISLLLFSHLLIPQYVMSGAGLAATLSFCVAGISLAAMFSLDHRIPLSDYLNLASLRITFQQILEQLVSAKK